jgi:prepilin-type N-terminal cleavage/methylation domain-containing protein
MKTDRKGFNLIEVLIAVAIIGVITLVVSPEIINSMETRGLENSVRDVISTMERAKFLAIKTKLNHRVLFDNSTGDWVMRIEQETSAGVWDPVPRNLEKALPSDFTLTLNLPSGDPSVVYNPMGWVVNFDALNHSVVMQSDRLARYGQPDQRAVVFYLGGSMRYVESSSTG